MDDLISRQALCEYALNQKDKSVTPNDIMRFPPAQPEIVRCKDCKYYGRADKRRFYRGFDCLMGRIATIVPDRDFCSRAERRTDD